MIIIGVAAAVVVAQDQRRCAFLVHLEMHRREGPVSEQLKRIKAEGRFRPVKREGMFVDGIADPTEVVTISLSDAGDCSG